MKTDQVVLITGALAGIGRAFARDGASTVISGRRDDAGQFLVSELRALGTPAEFIRSDVRRDEDLRNLVDKTVARFGRLDVAVNNAGTDEVKAKLLSGVPLKRAGKPEDIADAIVFLASDQAAYITGAGISVNGGKFA